MAQLLPTCHYHRLIKVKDTQKHVGAVLCDIMPNKESVVVALFLMMYCSI